MGRVTGTPLESPSLRGRELPAHLSARAGAGCQQQWAVVSLRLPVVMLVPEQREPLGTEVGRGAVAKPGVHVADTGDGTGSPRQLTRATAPEL